MSDYSMAKQSLKEEQKAVQNYVDRGGRAKSPQLKKHLSHALGEEKEHVRLFKKDVKKKRYSDKEVNRAREMYEGSSANESKPYMKGRVY